MCLNSTLSAAPNDYVSLDEEIIFPPSTANLQTRCRQITVNDDMILEAAEEMFSVLLETDDPHVSLAVENSRATVTLTDNDAGICLNKMPKAWS